MLECGSRNYGCQLGYDDSFRLNGKLERLVIAYGWEGGGAREVEAKYGAPKSGGPGPCTLDEYSVIICIPRSK